MGLYSFLNPQHILQNQAFLADKALSLAKDCEARIVGGVRVLDPIPPIIEDLLQYVDNPLAKEFKLPLQWESCIFDALEVLYSYSPSLRNIIPLLIQDLSIFEADGEVGGSCSFRGIPGIVIIQYCSHWSKEELAGSLLHEAIHQELYLEESVGQLITSQEANELVASSSIKKTERPYVPAYHALLISVQLAAMYVEIGAMDYATYWIQDTPSCLQSVKEGAFVLTSKGKEYLNECEEKMLWVQRKLNIA